MVQRGKLQGDLFGNFYGFNGCRRFTRFLELQNFLVDGCVTVEGFRVPTGSPSFRKSPRFNNLIGKLPIYPLIATVTGHLVYFAETPLKLLK